MVSLCPRPSALDAAGRHAQRRRTASSCAWCTSWATGSGTSSRRRSASRGASASTGSSSRARRRHAPPAAPKPTCAHPVERLRGRGATRICATGVLHSSWMMRQHGLPPGALAAVSAWVRPRCAQPEGGSSVEAPAGGRPQDLTVLELKRAGAALEGAAVRGRDGRQGRQCSQLVAGARMGSLLRASLGARNALTKKQTRRSWRGAARR